MPVICMVLNCRNRNDRDKISFYSVPKVIYRRGQPELTPLAVTRRSKWLEAVNRQDLTPTKIKNQKICGVHFISGKPARLEDMNNPDWVPTLHMGHSSASQSNVKRTKQLKSLKRIQDQRKFRRKRSIVENPSGHKTSSNYPPLHKRGKANTSKMNLICFVPNCKNTTGAVFPNDEELRKKWLESLNIEDATPSNKSFVCFEHFDESCFLLDADGVRFKNRIKEGSIPTIRLIKKDDCDEESESKPDNSHTNDEESGTNDGGPGTIDENVDSSINSVEDGEGNNSIVGEGDASEEKSENVTQEITPKVEPQIDNEKNEDLTTCRLCMSTQNVKHNISDQLDQNSTIQTAIITCLNPIQISTDDELSKFICDNCLNSLKSCVTFRTICLAMDAKQQTTLSTKTKRKQSVDSNEASTSKKARTLEDLTKELENELEADDDDDHVENPAPEPVVTINASMLEKGKSSSPPPLAHFAKPSPLSSPKIVKKVVQKRSSQSEIDKKFDKVEEELMKVLGGRLQEELKDQDNIIISVESDDDKVTKNLIPSKIEAKIKRIKPGSNVKSVLLTPATKPNAGKRVVIRPVSRPAAVKVEAGTSSIVLPKGIRVTVPIKYESDVGTYEGKVLPYVFKSEFCVVDGYLFEYRLKKGNVRYLKCLVPTCRALAEQQLAGEHWSPNVTVKESHNHHKPLQPEMKKQMFFYIMKRKMQSDKTLNFRHVYEEVCIKDPQIAQLVPLRNVINEICRHQLTYKIPTLASFDHFFELIEDDCFQKLHFTNDGKQFYQEKVQTEDGSRAIIFGNCDVINMFSFSKLMYVDASFKIDTPENFKYQLVTVLVWVDDSYYPILFALVNKKSLEVYKKIFEYLHDVLAPSLRPEEIVTDYEANLYYALGETYLDSHIGGSVFYYTQNLYKKICALNLSRELESNSYFRNIYHMLLMLPLLPVNTIMDGLDNIEIQVEELGLLEVTKHLFEHVRSQWIVQVTPDLFCVHRLENRINENVIAPFKKLRDFLMLSKGKMQKKYTSVVGVVEKLIELDQFLQVTYATPSKRAFSRDLSSSQKKNVLKAWSYIESHPRININNFFSKVLGYIKCMENQLWIWGFYRCTDDVNDDLINASNFSIISTDLDAQNEDHEHDEMHEGEEEVMEAEEEEMVEEEHHLEYEQEGEESNSVVMEAVISENGEFVLQDGGVEQGSPFENAFMKYVYKE